jgi:hypothetical protein
MQANMLVTPSFLASSMSLIQDHLAYALMCLPLGKEIDERRSPGEGGYGIVGMEKAKAQHLSLFIFGCQKGIALGHVHKEVEKLGGDLSLGKGSKAALHVIVVDLHYLIAVFWGYGLQLAAECAVFQLADVP